jgi:hypothetical protein
LLRAVALAKACGAVLHVCAFVEPVPIVHLWEEKVDEAAFQSYLRRYRRWMSEEIQRLSGEGLKVTVEVVFTTHPLLDILKHVEEFKPDLLIKDATLEPVLKRVFITPLDCHLLRESLHLAFVTLADRYGVPPERRHFVMGQPVRVLSEFVEEYLADVVVMGTVHLLATDYPSRRLMCKPGEGCATNGDGALASVEAAVHPRPLFALPVLLHLEKQK